MATTWSTASRREFLKASLLGGLGAAGAARWAGPGVAGDEPPTRPSTRVALTAGDDHVAQVFRGLKTFQDEIAKAIGDRRVITESGWINHHLTSGSLPP
jgi:hypothetical protein